MKSYELAVVYKPSLDEEALKAEAESVKALIERFGGSVEKVDDWGKRRLAYEIQKMNEGFYYFIHFDAEAGVPAQVEENVRIMDNVLRFLCVRADEA